MLEFLILEPEWDFMKLLEDVEGVERDKAVFECDVNDPEAEVTWWRGDKVSGAKKRLPWPCEKKFMLHQHSFYQSTDDDAWKSSLCFINQELSGGGKYEIIKDNFKRRLVVKNCHMKDDGEYTCKVLDKSTKASLFVERKSCLTLLFFSQTSFNFIICKIALYNIKGILRVAWMVEEIGRVLRCKL